MNESKTYHCTSTGVFAHYTDSRRHFFIPYEKDAMEKSQNYGNTYRGFSYKDFEDNRYSYQQNRMYQKCLYGIKVCSKAEIKNMSFADKMMIHYNHIKTQQLINLSKWQLDCEIANHTILLLFKKIGNNVNWLLNITNDLNIADSEEINYNSLHTIGGKNTLIEKLVEQNILPSNFYKLNK